jgi:hypothetical protein
LNSGSGEGALSLRVQRKILVRQAIELSLPQPVFDAIVAKSSFAIVTSDAGRAQLFGEARS